SYDRYKSRLLASMLGAFLAALFLALLILMPAAFSEGPSLLPYILERSKTGSETDIYPAVLELQDGESVGLKELTITVPARDLSPDEKSGIARQILEDIRKQYDGIRIDDSLSFPSSSGLVKLSYTSLSPEVIRSDGTLLTVPQEKELPVRIRIDGRLDEVKESVIVSFYLSAYESLSADRKAEILAGEIENGAFLDEKQLSLPDEDPLGRSVVYYRKKETGYGVMVLLILFPLMIYLLEESRVRTVWKERSRQSLMHLSDFTGELSILLGAGMSLSMAFTRMADDYRQRQKQDGKTIVLYEELCRLDKQLSQGGPINEALQDFAERLQLKEIRRLCALLLQSERRGNDQLLERLDEFSKEAWEERKKQVRELSEVADTKLTFPLMLMLIAVILLVLAPSLISMSGWG
ncbi:MAG: type II secretion system F family protein, partial [Firmicutes bacterium]|nr:type II secretion system F family protein [Bacillota bacterium]